MKAQLITVLQEKFDNNFCSAIQFSPVPKGKSGDLALSFFDLAKTEGKSPMDIAKDVAPILEASDVVEKTEMAGPYLNVFFADAVFFTQVLKTPLSTDLYQGQTILVEYSSPNTNKPLHLGHMRNHALGISISNLLESVGANVKKVAIINDRGVHICKSMLAYQKFGNGETPESTGEKSDDFVGRYYVQFEQESKKDPKLLEEVQEMLRQWEAGDPEVRELWERMNGWTYEGHERTYKRQGVHFDKKYYESDTYEMGRDIIEKGVEQGVFYKRDDNATMIDLEDEGLDKKVVLRPDGTSVYVTQDLATTFLRFEDFHFDRHIWIVADEQNYHFQVVIHCLDRLKLLPKERLFHLGYGLVHLPDGRMKSREGTVVDADNLMNELSSMALEEIKKRDPDVPEAEQHLIAEQIMNAAWKFYLLSTSPRKTITFNIEDSIAFEGATGPYLQYAGVRLRSIFRKVDKMPSPLPLGEGQGEGPPFLQALSAPEKPLGVKILEFPETLNRAAEHKNPTYIITYLLELCQIWSRYYAENSILNAESEDLKNARLVLAQKVFEVLETGLEILGIEIPERM